ncbi:MAG: SUMF1/EgtB/PvdO family nonheme iron enzyme, partial [Phycisphaerales bacterium]
TEVRVDQWVRFLNAYAPSHEAQGGDRGDSEFGRGIFHNPVGVQPANYQSFNDSLITQNMSWYMAARYCNWLHNGAPDASVVTIADFETGAYDTSTFRTTRPASNGEGFVSNEQIHRSEGARFWIPSLDEWIKAAHYDPDRHGEGQEGYWLRMGGQDEPLTPGAPGDGGQTNAGDPDAFEGEPFLDWARAGSYPGVQSPWGLLDTSGGEAEWVEDKLIAFNVGDGENTSMIRYNLGSLLAAPGFEDRDLIDRLSSTSGASTFPGLRIAAAVPGPGGLALGGAAGLVCLTRRRR